MELLRLKGWNLLFRRGSRDASAHRNRKRTRVQLATFRQSATSLLTFPVPEGERLLSSEQLPVRLVVAASIEKLEDWK
jgi:hypothetical protein